MNDLTISKIELLELQIENVERSGFFTEKQIDALVFPLRQELETLKKQIELYGMTYENYREGTVKHTELFSQMISPALKNTWKSLGMNGQMATT